MIASDAIARAQEHGKTLSVEMGLSTLTFAIASLEKLKDLTPEDVTRIRQAVVRLSNLERRLSRG